MPSAAGIYRNPSIGWSPLQWDQPDSSKRLFTSVHFERVRKRVSEMSEKLSRTSEKLSRTSSLRELVALVAEATWHDNHKGLIVKAAGRAQISYRQAKSLFYGEITDPNHRSARLMQDAAEELAGRYERIAERMGQVDEAFYGLDRAALLASARRLRSLSGARNRS
jgi:hypothetical protein